MPIMTSLGNRYLRFFLLLTVFGLITGCSTLRVETDYDRSTDFSKFGTFDWSADDPGVQKSFFDTALRQAVNAELTAVGLSQSSDNPDLIVVTHVSLDEVITGATVSHWNHGGWGWYGGWGGMSTSTVHVNAHDQGTLIMDLIDASNNQLVWRGIAEKEVNDPRATREQLQPIVQKLLADFPPGASM